MHAPAHHAAGHVLGDSVQSLRNGFRALIRGIHFARTVQTLYGMSDAQLAQLGLTRDDIPHYAQRCLDEA